MALSAALFVAALFLLSTSVVSARKELKEEGRRSASASMSPEEGGEGGGGDDELSAEGKWGDETIRCRVCFAAMDHMWQRGEVERKRCEEGYKHETEETPMGCDRDHANMNTVKQIVATTCHQLSSTHQGEHHEERGFRMRAHESPSHSEEETSAIIKSCDKWVLRGGAQITRVSNYLYQNLENKETSETARLSMRKWMCQRVCQRGWRGKKPSKPRYDEDL